MKKIFLPLIIIANTLFSSGCLLTSTVGTVFVVSNDRRTTGEIVDDKSIEFSLFGWGNEDKVLESAHLNFMVYNKEAVITGEVPTVAVRDYITEQAMSKDFKIRKIINEVRIAKNSSLLSRTKDSIITAKAEILFYNQDVFNPLYIKVMTENRTIYLMGALTAREADKATKIASTVGGVERVVKLFRYLKALPAAEIERNKRKKLAIEKERELKAEQAIIDVKKSELRRQIKALDPNGGTDF